MANARDYLHIEAWGRMMGSFTHYIRVEQNIAAEENAPIDATYQGGDKRWHTLADCKNQETADEVTRRVEALRSQRNG